MPKLTALIHAHPDDGRRLGRLLETLRPCDEVLIVNHGPDEEIEKIARQYGASTRQALPGVSTGAYLMDAKNDWILSLLPSESLTEGLEASLFEWKGQDHEPRLSYSVAIRRENGAGWSPHPPVTRLVNRTAVNWITDLPENDPGSEVLVGDLLRFENP
ncbi:MAG TPA: hypothetical protein VD837_10890 [Terriglobales bacterium]|nr:hypothetical protein [Terriglobales bacterium]